MSQLQFLIHTQRLKDMGWLTPAQMWPKSDPVYLARVQSIICRRSYRKIMAGHGGLKLHRITPGLIKSEDVGVQPMSQPVSLIFSMRYNYGDSNAAV